MATRSKSVSGNLTTYTITDVAGNTMSVVVNTTPGLEITTTYSGGPILQDGAQALMILMQLVSTGLLP